MLIIDYKEEELEKPQKDAYVVQTTQVWHASIKVIQIGSKWDVSMIPMESILVAISSDLTRSCLEDLPTSGLVLDYYLLKKKTPNNNL